MSLGLISRSGDLKRLQDEGYEIELRAGFLLAKHVPYVNSDRQVEYGVLVSTLDLAGEVTSRPDSHVAMFAGGTPCDREGRPLVAILNSSERRDLGSGIVIDHTFSSKPADGYADYYDKVTTYVNILAAPAKSINPDATAQTHPVIETTEQESVFLYADTASSRAQIGAISDRLKRGRVAIVGLGGTGAYILDLVAKTHVPEIHLFDGDLYLQHNAFRSPGAPLLDELRARPSKVAYYAERYSRMRRGIVPHESYVDEEHVSDVCEMDFVFLAFDDHGVKDDLVRALEEQGTPFIDVGMGVYETDGLLAGLVRVTSSTAQKRDHVHAEGRIPLAGGPDGDDYSSNIQIADLNDLNAALAVIRWKKFWEFYRDLEHEHHSVYTIDGNHLVNEDVL